MLAVLCIAAPLSSSALAETPVAAAAFECQGGKSIDATFYANSVDVGRALRQQGREFVFWNKGDTAFVTEGKDGKETYSGCGPPNDRACLAILGMFSRANLRMSAATTVAAVFVALAVASASFASAATNGGSEASAGAL
jgi:hypothetical protein